jgi:hypothetical protein
MPEFLLFRRLLVRRTVDANARETKFRRVFLEIMAEFTFRGQKLDREALYNKYAASLPVLPQNRKILFCPPASGIFDCRFWIADLRLNADVQISNLQSAICNPKSKIQNPTSPCRSPVQWFRRAVD